MPQFLRLVADAAQHDPDLARRALVGLRVYQSAQRIDTPLLPDAVATRGRASLRDYGGEGPIVIFIPSLINPPTILDLERNRSMLRWLATQRLHPMLVDWGTATARDRDIGLAGHVEEQLVPLIDAVGAPVALVGYCLGGTLALGAAMLRPPTALALIAAPWHFTAFSQAEIANMTALWTSAQPASAALGLMPMEVMQAGFWQLDPTRTVRKYADFARLAPDGEAAARFVAMEDWANAGSPIPYAAAHDMFELLFGLNLTGDGGWRVGGIVVDPARLTCPALDIVSTSDRIVPSASAAGLSARLDLAAGHVGMIAGSNGPSGLWRPLADWLKNAI